MRRLIGWCAGGAVFGIAFVCCGPAVAADAPVPEIPLTSSMGMGARALGMGGAHVAVVEDLSAIAYNPAGLAQIRRIEISGTLAYHSRDQKVTLFGASSDVSLNNTHVNSIGIAYPFPTYRGSLVVAGAYNRRVNLNSDYLRQGPAPPFQPQDVEEILEEGGLDVWSGAAALDISPNISIGGSLSYLSGSTDRRDDFIYSDARYDDSYSSTTASDISGWTGSFGALVRVGPMARLGFAIQFPQPLDFDGTQTIDESFTDRDSTQNSFSSYDEFTFLDEIDLPISVAAGVAVTPSNFVFAADVRYTDWTQIRFVGPLRLASREDAYRGATEIHLGAEYVLPVYPVRFRAGFYTEPVAYKLVLDDVFYGEYVPARFDPDRKFFTFGVGALFEEVLTVDVAYVQGSFERSGTDVTEGQDERRVYLSTAFRF